MQFNSPCIADQVGLPATQQCGGDAGASKASGRQPRGSGSLFRHARRTARMSPGKMKRWKGRKAYQYRYPGRPCGSKNAVCSIRAPSTSGRISNCSHAVPGSFISARRRSEMRWIERLDPPEVHGLADAELAGVAATPSHAHPAEHPVDEPPKLP